MPPTRGRGPSRGMTPEDVYELVTVGDPRVSPDGKTVAFVVTTIDRDESTYTSAIWMVPTDGSAKPRRFTFGDRRDASPRWSPDGTRLAFVSTRDNEKAAQLYVIPVEGGEALQLTDTKESVDEATWSPDGTTIAFSSRVRDKAYDEEKDSKRTPRHIKKLKYRLDSVGWTFDRPRYLFVVPSDGSSEPRQITKGSSGDSTPTWAPDSKRIAFVSARHRNSDIDLVNDIYVTDVTGSKPRKVTRTEDSCSAPSWSPDGKFIAFNCTPERVGTKHQQVAVVDAAGRTRRKVLTYSLDRNCSPFMAGREPMWQGNNVVFAIEDHGNNALYNVRTSGTSKP
ncbi:MAG: S9 family peptidase, partial [Actinomycetota bacterium]